MAMAGDSSVKSGNNNVRNTPLLTKEHESRRFGEVAGGTTAECAAVVCCPCALVNLAFLAFVKLPAGLCKKAWCKSKRKRNKNMKKKKNQGMGMESESELEENSAACSQDELLTPRHSVVNANASANSLVMQQTTPVCTQKVWEEVVGKSYVGFWRNVSFRE